MTHAADNAVYFGAGFTVRRPRPLTYNPLVPTSEKTGTGKSNSFFSGHTSFSSAATFFMAKVYTDYHHIRGWNRILAYTIAAVPPALVGYYRMRAGKHFKTDVMLGFLVGATSGIIVPELHRNKEKKNALTMIPYYSEGSGGITATVKF
jgi:membrane-associated phospholipid phosphatase